MTTPHTETAYLILQNGECFPGLQLQGQAAGFGEVVFTTGMTGYPESLTDPSFAGQILVFTYPLIGNYGVPDKSTWESEKIHAAGVVLSAHPTHFSHHSALLSLQEWLAAHHVPLITGVDTRALTKILRHTGTMAGAITCDPHTTIPPGTATHWVDKVAPKKPSLHQGSDTTIIAVDCGMKESIMRHLQQKPWTIKRVPHDYDFTNDDYDGVLISNGPGDPTACTALITTLKKAIQQDKPLFGICLGTQLMALAAGASTYKLPFGHRGQNQPCMELATKRCFITSQNHGYAVAKESLPKDWAVSFTNLNDGSVEGIRHTEKPFFAVQFHPEAAPGPTDTTGLFDTFYQLVTHEST